LSYDAADPIRMNPTCLPGANRPVYGLALVIFHSNLQIAPIEWIGLVRPAGSSSLKPKLSKLVITELVITDTGLPYSAARCVLAVIFFQK